MQIVHATFRSGEGKEAVKLLETLGLDIEDYKLIESPTGDLLIVNLLYGNKDDLLDNLESRFDFQKDCQRSLAILTPDTVIPRNEEKIRRDSYRSTRESLITYARDNSHINLDYFILVLASTVIVTLGLLLDNVAVIIGAMVIAPVLGPIMAVPIGIVLADYRLIKSGILAEGFAVLLAVLVSALLTLVVPGAEVTQSLEIRMYPTLADLLIALGSGAAAAYTVIKGKEPLGLVGVMVAAALLPVMATVGAGFALGERQMVTGALLLLGGNFLGLLLANLVVFYFEGLRPQIWYKHKAGAVIKKSLVVILVFALLLGIPLTLMTVYQFYAEQPEEIIKNSLRRELDINWDYRLESINIQGNLVEVYLYGEKPLPEETLASIKKEVQNRLEEEYYFNFRLINISDFDV